MSLSPGWLAGLSPPLPRQKRDRCHLTSRSRSGAAFNPKGNGANFIPARSGCCEPCSARGAGAACLQAKASGTKNGAKVCQGSACTAEVSPARQRCHRTDRATTSPRPLRPLTLDSPRGKDEQHNHCPERKIILDLGRSWRSGGKGMGRQVWNAVGVGAASRKTRSFRAGKARKARL